MLRKLIVPGALIALSACAGSPSLPAARAARMDANPGIGSGAGLLPPPDEDSAGQLGSGAKAESSGFMGSGYLVDAAPGIGAGVGLLPEDSPGGILGSGTRQEGTARSGFVGSGF
jgi:hypothetical protein